MRKTLLVLTVAMSTFLWMSRTEPAYAKTIACQGSPTAGGEIITGASEPGNGELVLASFTSLPGVDNTVALIGGGNAALWSVTITNSKFTRGNLTTTNTLPPVALPVVTCFYTLDSASSFTSNNGTVQQTLIWDPVSGNPPQCSDQFTDHVYLVNNGAAAVMIDDNLSGEDIPGAGNCVLL